MCLSPKGVYLKDGTLQEAACTKCKQCRSRAIDDWTGRNIAEFKTAAAAHVVTLTYGRDRLAYGDALDHPSAAVLTYSDVQRFQKRLRSSGFPMRYFFVGEYGETKRRAHWHGIIYWLGKVPDGIELRKNINHDMWPHGHAWFDHTSPEAVRYACKYLYKDQGVEKQSMPRMSKLPPLGSRYFVRLAYQIAEAGLAPQDLFYRHKLTRRDGSETIQQYMLQGKSAEIYLDAYIGAWRRLYPGAHLPNSELVEARLDKLAGPVDFNIHKLEADAKARRKQERIRQLRGQVPWRGPTNLEEWEVEFLRYYGKE